jgi:hypothetical protein
MTIDFSQLYAELGLNPDCSLEAFQRAYRQRLSERHPDRSHNAPTVLNALPLSDLIALHSSAITFHREHGRLPGGCTVTAAQIAPHVRHVPVDSIEADNDRSTTMRWVLAILLLAGSLLFGVMHEQSQPQPNANAVAPEAANTSQIVARPNLADGPLELGMDTRTVREIQGEPMRINDGTWEYGPSWLRFEHGELVDWYSSPLHRLKTSAPSPDNR